jgi:phage shock protein B
MHKKLGATATVTPQRTLPMPAFWLEEGQLALMIPIVAIMGFVFLAALKILRDILRPGPAATSARDQAQEARLIQDIYHGLLKMEERVEALETLLLEREKKGDES